MEEKLNGAEELYLAPQEHGIEDTQQIADLSMTQEDFSFIIEYELSEKELLLSEFEKIGAVVENESDLDCSVKVRMSKEQLATIKTLSCVKCVQIDSESEADLTYDIRNNLREQY